jgi:hypothetical protein
MFSENAIGLEARATERGQGRTAGADRPGWYAGVVKVREVMRLLEEEGNAEGNSCLGDAAGGPEGRKAMRPRQYLVRLDKDPGSDWGASVPDLPGCVATGRTIDATMRRIERANEGAPGSGVGEWIEAELSRPVRIAYLTVTPGWDYVGPRTGVDLFTANRSLTAFDLDYDGGVRSFTIPEGQRLFRADLGGAETTRFRIVARGVNGGPAQYEDLCIGEVRIFESAGDGAAIPLDAYEATVTEYGLCVAAGACTQARVGADCNAGAPGRSRHPINCVDWNQAVAYCRWAGGPRGTVLRTAAGHRLPLRPLRSRGPEACRRASERRLSRAVFPHLRRRQRLPACRASGSRSRLADEAVALHEEGPEETSYCASPIDQAIAMRMRCSVTSGTAPQRSRSDSARMG